MRRSLLAALLGLAFLVATPAAQAVKPPPGPPAPFLKFWYLDGHTALKGGFTGPVGSDGDRKSINVDATTINDPVPNPNAIYAVSFENWWGQSLVAVQQLKINTQEPLAGGSPRISVTLSTTADGSSGWDAGTLFLDPNYCNSSNANGWRTSNWRGGANCTTWDDQGRSYAGNGVLSGWDVMLASGDHAGAFVYYAYIVQDQPIGDRVDRITLDSLVFTK
jgi:hypothetical protein